MNPEKIKRKFSKSAIKEAALGYLFILPAMALLFVFVFYSIIRGFFLSFTDLDYLKGWQGNFIGLGNYTAFFQDPQSGQVLTNVLIFVTCVTVFTILLGLAIAILINKVKRGKNVLRSLLFLPWVLPEVVVGSTWRWIFDGEKGILDSILVDHLHLAGSYIQWLGEGLVLTSVIIVYIWRTYPFVTIMISAGLQTIDRELYEAASIDGAGKSKIFFHITLPQLKFVLSICILITIIWTNNGFGILNILTGGGPMLSSTNLPILIYQTAFVNMRMGYASAISMIQFLLVFIFGAIYMKTTATMKEV